jgi:hypothetical protein
MISAIRFDDYDWMDIVFRLSFVLFPCYRKEF